jgi:hypothetical protein
MALCGVVVLSLAPERTTTTQKTAVAVAFTGHPVAVLFV